MSTIDRARVGGGYIFHSENNLDFDVSYDLLLRQILMVGGRVK